LKQEMQPVLTQPSGTTRAIVRYRIALTLTLLLGFSLLASACGSTAAPGIASLRTTPPRKAPTQRSPTASAPAYAACMTAHGVAMAPPDNHHGLTILGNAAPGSAQFETAEHACQKLEPPGGSPPLTPAQQAQAAQALARFAACMRKHNVPGFPDPNGQGSFPETRIEALNTNTPFFQHALKSCDQLYPHTAPQIAFPGGSHT
jgi:hypothetical protein